MRKQIITEADYRRSAILVSKLRSEILFLERRGYSKREIDSHLFETLMELESGLVSEGVLDAIGGGLAWLSNNKFLQPIQNMIANKIADFLGMRDGFLRNAFVNVLENMDFDTIKSLLSGEEGRCEKVTSKIVGSLQETVVEYILKQVGLEPTSFFGGLIKDVMVNVFAEDGPLVRGITDTVCSISLTDIISGRTRVEGLPEIPEPSGPRGVASESYRRTRRIAPKVSRRR